MLSRILRFPLEIIFTVFILLDETVRPIYRPLIRRVAAWRLTRRFEGWVSARHRFTILALLAVPFAIVEPLKVIALLWIGRGSVAAGIMTLALAHLASFIIVERIYSAGRTKLLTIGWLAYVMALVTAVRKRLFEWIRATDLWQAAARLRAELAASFRSRTKKP